MKNKNKSNNKEHNNNKLIISLMIVVILLVSVTIFILNYSFNDTNLTILEKKWVADNSNTMLDVSTYNNIPIFGKNGQGVIYDFLDNFTANYDITFNKVSYLTTNTGEYRDVAFKVVPGYQELSEHDIVMYNDYYALLSINYANYSNIDDITKLEIGVLSTDLEQVKYYLGEETNTYTEFKDIDNMIETVKNEKIPYIILPINQYINKIAANNLKIDYKFTGLNNKYILSIKDDTLYSIFNKYYSIYIEKQYQIDYSKQLLNIYFESLNISDTNKTNYNNKTYNIGYVRDMPFIGGEEEDLSGMFYESLKEFATMADIDLNYKEYKNISELKQAINMNLVDVSYSSYSTSGITADIKSINIPSNREYIILSKEYFNIDSLKGLKGKNNVYTIKDSYLDNVLIKAGIKTKAYNNSDELLRNIDDNSIIVTDSITYKYYQNKKFNDYLVVHTANLEDDYTFVVSNNPNNEVFNGLFTTYITLLDYDTLKQDYITVSTNITIEQIKSISKYLLILFSIIFIFLLLSFIIINKKKKQKLAKPSDKLKYIDLMTSVKNRNYLNHNIKKWESSHRYPQSVIIVDLNNIKYINDNYGHEEGDNVIKKAANILIVNQLENSDIMRTDGNEFLIYLLGYDEKQIVSYCHKLFKELKGLPYNFGATLGHSMIEDDIKTIEDAINEATIEMREAKEKMK